MVFPTNFKMCWFQTMDHYLADSIFTKPICTELNPQCFEPALKTKILLTRICLHVVLNLALCRLRHNNLDRMKATRGIPPPRLA